MSHDQDLSAKGLLASDEKLHPLKAVFDHYFKPSSDEAVVRAAHALEKNTHKVTIVNNRKDVVDVIAHYIPKGASVYNAGSTTLFETGVTELLKTHTEWNNLHKAILEEKDQQKAAELRRHAMGADYFLSSAAAISETGEIVVCDATTTRTGGFLTATNVVVVVGANKIVPTYADAIKRTEEFALPWESARSRVAYKAYGVQGSAVNNLLAIKGGNPFGKKERFHVIIVKGDALGF